MKPLAWWQTSVFYQIYPRSFADRNGDGIGDLGGILSRLEYLAWLGVDAIWLSPHYPSPLYDCGYDIADYTGVAREYGTLEDFKQFLDTAHQLGMRVILDWVLNHTSVEHTWFKESRSSKNHPKRDWYIWRDGVNGGPPNNWVSPFGGSAWEHDLASGQYYYHFFFKQQPDLNWRNPEVKQAMFDAARFWLDLGVDGFRLDAIGTVFEHPDLPDHQAPISLAELRRQADTNSDTAHQQQLEQIWRQMFYYQVEQPGMHELLQELRSVVDEYPERMLVAESEEISYHGDGSNEMHLVFNFPLMRTEKLTPAWVRANQAQRLAELAEVTPAAWPCNTLGNHDSPRLYSAYSPGEYAAELARVKLALLLTLKGTPFLYNGEEIGMVDLYLDDISQFKDMLGVWYYQAQLEELQLPPQEALRRAASTTRDKNRTPMQWNNAPQAGFCPPEVEPWLPVHPNYAAGVNVADQQGEPGSLLNFYRGMLALRRRTPALIAGDYIALDAPETQPEWVLSFLRTTPAQSCLVALNFSPHPQELDFAGALYAAAKPAGLRLLFSNTPRPEGEHSPNGKLKLLPFEIYIARLTLNEG